MFQVDSTWKFPSFNLITGKFCLCVSMTTVQMYMYNVRVLEKLKIVLGYELMKVGMQDLYVDEWGRL